MATGLVAAACGGSGDEPADGDSVTTSPGAAVIGSDGGTVESTDGAFSLSIPSGALSDDVEVSLALADPPDLPEDLAGPAGPLPVYSAEPAGLEFDTPVTVTWQIPFSSLPSGPPPLSVLFPATLSGDEVELLSDVVVAIEKDGLRLTATTRHFSSFFAAAAIEIDGCVIQAWLPPSVVGTVESSIDVPLGNAIYQETGRVVLQGDRLADFEGDVKGCGALARGWTSDGSIRGPPTRSSSRQATFPCEAEGLGSFQAEIEIRVLDSAGQASEIRAGSLFEVNARGEVSLRRARPAKVNTTSFSIQGLATCLRGDGAGDDEQTDPWTPEEAIRIRDALDPFAEAMEIMKAETSDGNVQFEGSRVAAEGGEVAGRACLSDASGAPFAGQDVDARIGETPDAADATRFQTITGPDGCVYIVIPVITPPGSSNLSTGAPVRTSSRPWTCSSSHPCSSTSNHPRATSRPPSRNPISGPRTPNPKAPTRRLAASTATPTPSRSTVPTRVSIPA